MTAKLSFFVILGFIVFASCVCLGAEAVPVVPVAEAPKDLSWLKAILTDLDVVWTAILKVGVILIGLIFGWWKKKDIDKADAIESLRVGVTETFQTYVDELKKAKADGVITKEESKIAREKAIISAKEHASGPALALLKSYSDKYLHSLVERIVQGMQKGKTA